MIPINHYVGKLKLFGRNDTIQDETLIFLVVIEVGQVPKVKRLEEMLLEHSYFELE